MTPAIVLSYTKQVPCVLALIIFSAKVDMLEVYIIWERPLGIRRFSSEYHDFLQHVILTKQSVHWELLNFWAWRTTTDILPGAMIVLHIKHNHLSRMSRYAIVLLCMDLLHSTALGVYVVLFDICSDNRRFHTSRVQVYSFAVTSDICHSSGNTETNVFLHPKLNA